MSASRPDWSTAKCYSESASSLNVCSEQVRGYATRNAEGEVDLQIVHARVRDMKYGGGRTGGARDRERDDELAEPWGLSARKSKGKTRPNKKAR